MLKNLAVDAWYRITVTALALVGMCLVIVATSRYGAGVSSDAARNLSTADSLMAGRGFVDMVGAPLVLWPPLYPLLLAGLGLLTGLGTFEVAWYLNVLLYGLNIWLAGWWFYAVFRDRPFYAIAGMLVFVLSRSMLRIHANVASEPLFETLILVFFLAAARYLKERVARGAVGDVSCCGAGRDFSAILVLPCSLWLQSSSFGGTERRGWVGVFCLGWSLLRPWGHGFCCTISPISGALFGPRELGAMLPLQNIGLGLTKILWWFAPRWGVLDWLILRPWIPIALLCLDPHSHQ